MEEGERKNETTARIERLEQSVAPFSHADHEGANANQVITSRQRKLEGKAGTEQFSFSKVGTIRTSNGIPVFNNATWGTTWKGATTDVENAEFVCFLDIDMPIENIVQPRACADAITQAYTWAEW